MELKVEITDVVIHDGARVPVGTVIDLKAGVAGALVDAGAARKTTKKVTKKPAKVSAKVAAKGNAK